ncbi:hypothetical protein H8B09_25160 [Paenibacillus sp. PR3]|uniref:Uncharacterized protein n=1 Tax=Paenibacillus terricola TaxID=2763503 RepID=A0ABR8N1L8_9BACL|nr:hypothetical protein [Paenibacillus terricola]MBD3922076.1 hypothetical protein [Paenibacillus terricola]
MNNSKNKLKIIYFSMLIVLIICLLTSCVQTKDSISPTPVTAPTSTATNLMDEDEPEMNDKPQLGINQAIDLASEKLDISKDKIKYVATDPASGIYEVSVNDYLNYYIDPVNGDFLNENREKIINLLGVKDEYKDESFPDLSIEDIVIENLKNNAEPHSDNVKYSAERKIPFFDSSGQRINGGLINDNTYITLSELGISESIDSEFRQCYSADVDNDGTDEIGCHGLGGTGLYPFTQLYKLDRATSKYSEWYPEIPDNSEYEGNYSDIQFFKSSNKVYMVVFDDIELRIFYLHSNKADSIASIHITYPTYEINTNSNEDVILHLKDKYAKKITFLDGDIPDEHVLQTTDPQYSLIDHDVREQFVGRTYTIADIDNDGEKELFFKWEAWSQTRLNSTLYLNGYAILKKKNNIYMLYDTNDKGRTSRYQIYDQNEGSTYPENIYFENYNGKVYTIIVDKDYYENVDFDMRKTDTFNVYCMNKSEFKNLGTIDVVWTPEIEITDLKK